MTPLGLAELRLDEGFSLTAYPDPRSPLGRACTQHGLQPIHWRQLPAEAQGLDGSPWTIGTGCTGADIGPDTVWTPDQAEAQLEARVAALETEFAALAWWAGVDPVRRDVLVNIAFNVGFSGLMHWPVTLGHFACGAYGLATKDLLTEGAWDAEVGDRSQRLADATKNGFWPQSLAA